MDGDAQAARLLEAAISRDGPEGLADLDICNLFKFLLVVKNHHNNSKTPVEDCIVEIADDYVYAQMRGRGLTPDDIVRRVDTRMVAGDGSKTHFRLRRNSIENTRTFRLPGRLGK